ncbi:MAG: sodium:alanine symporter family protein [Desulfurococcales archaeon]|nr:sodium:alanine symporter family protein [Desulfurococcales archaeon]
MSIIDIINLIDSLVWGLPMIIILVATGLTIGIMSGFFQIRKFGVAIKTMKWRGKKGAGEVHPFKIWAMVMGATIGVGNIAGASTAVHLGGAGALFWMWVCGILGMGLKAAEVTLGVWSRRVLPDGRIEGGTPYYIRLVPKIGPILAVLFSLFAFTAAFGIGNMVQANNVALGAEYVAKMFGATGDTIFYVRLVTGILIALFTALVVLGGLRRIAEVANYMVPFMAAWYIIFGIGIWIIYGGNFALAISEVFRFAFSPQAAFGGLAGWTVYSAIRYGFARGLFSNEAGLGSAPNAYAYAESDHPGRQGFYGVFEVFMDTIVICTITIMADIVTRAYIERPDLSGAALAMEAFFRAYGEFAPVLLGVALALFAYTTLLTWEYYGEVNWKYFWVKILHLPEKPMTWIWRVLWIIPIIPAAISPELFETFWNFSDMTNGLMAIPNLVAVIYLSPIAISLIKDFYSRHIYETGEAGGGSAVSSAVQVLSGFGKDLFRSMYTPTYKLVMEKR